MIPVPTPRSTPNPYTLDNIDAQLAQAAAHPFEGVAVAGLLAVRSRLIAANPRLVATHPNPATDKD